MKRIIFALGSVVMVAMPIVAVVSCSKKIPGDDANHVDSGTKGKEVWKTLSVDLKVLFLKLM